MAKKKQAAPVRKQEKEKSSLADVLNQDLVKQLKQKQKELQLRDELQQQEELERKKREAREREKNKSFEDLLNESNLSWREFK